MAPIHIDRSTPRRAPDNASDLERARALFASVDRPMVPARRTPAPTRKPIPLTEIATEPIPIAPPAAVPAPIPPAEERPKSTATSLPKPPQETMRPAEKGRTPAAGDRPASSCATVETDLTLTSDSNFYCGFDAASFGLFIATHANRPLGSVIDVSMRLDGQFIKARAVIRWIREVDDRNPETVPGLGVQFLSLADEAKEAVARFNQLREPIFYAE